MQFNNDPASSLSNSPKFVRIIEDAEGFEIIKRIAPEYGIKFTLLNDSGEYVNQKDYITYRKEEGDYYLELVYENKNHLDEFWKKFKATVTPKDIYFHVPGDERYGVLEPEWFSEGEHIAEATVDGVKLSSIDGAEEGRDKKYMINLDNLDPNKSH